MTTRTRYFIIVSLLILTVGVGTGLVAYYIGVPGGQLFGPSGPNELQYVPRDAAVVAYADVREIMTSEVRQKIRHALPASADDGQRQFQDQTGIAIESDIDRIVACLQPHSGGKTAGLVLARGRFNEVRIEGLMREHGAEVEEYSGKRVIANRNAPPPEGDSIALSFLEPGLVAVGGGQMVRTAIDLRKTGDSVTKNREIMDLMRSLDRGNAWAIGRFDALASDARLPPQVASRLPAITWFSISGRVGSSLSGVLRADTRDEEAANNLRDVVRGFLALAKLQAGNRPEFQAMMQSLELGGTGKSVALSFSVPGEVFDAIGATLPPAPPKPPVH